MRTGIAICTFNRLETLQNTISRIRSHTKSEYDLIVVDDGSSDGTFEAISNSGTKIMSATNRGIAWNKNRALFYLKNIAKSDAIIVIEDDTFPLEDGWEKNWIEAIVRWGHINLAARYWGKGSFHDGDGTPQRPYKSHHVSAQCAGFSSDALDYIGYMDSRFRGWGMEHVEHTDRFLRGGYGGEPITILNRNIYYLIDSNLEILFKEESVGVELQRKRELIAQSIDTCIAVGKDKIKRDPWINDEEMIIFVSEFNQFLKKKYIFCLKNDDNRYICYDNIQKRIRFVPSVDLFGDGSLCKVVCYYDGFKLKLATLSGANVDYIRLSAVAVDVDPSSSDNENLEFDVFLDKKSGMYLSRNGLYLSCEKAKEHIASISRPEPSDWERFFFSHFEIVS